MDMTISLVSGTFRGTLKIGGFQISGSSDLFVSPCWGSGVDISGVVDPSGAAVHEDEGSMT